MRYGSTVSGNSEDQQIIQHYYQCKQPREFLHFFFSNFSTNGKGDSCYD